MASVNKLWSFSTGERGTNRVRAFEKTRGGLLFLEFYERDVTGELVRKRVSLQHADRERAKAKAEQIAAEFRKQGVQREEMLTLKSLFDNYLKEVTPRKGYGKQLHDRQAAEMLMRVLDPNREPKTLNRRDWDRFIQDRRNGTLRPTTVKKPRPVRDQQIRHDLKFLLAVIHWAMRVSDHNGRPLMEFNPLRGLSLPKEESPQRPLIMSEQYEKLCGVAHQISPLFGLALVIAHETGHRLGSIRQLKWQDVDLVRRTIRWVGEFDKLGFEHETPLSETACEVLERARRDQGAIGGAWIFPAPTDATKPAPRITFLKWFERGWDLAELGKRPARTGWHSFRRKFATELKSAPLRDLAYMGGWKNAQTVVQVYQRPDEDTMRQALAGRRSIAVGTK